MSVANCGCDDDMTSCLCAGTDPHPTNVLAGRTSTSVHSLRHSSSNIYEPAKQTDLRLAHATNRNGPNVLTPDPSQLTPQHRKDDTATSMLVSRKVFVHFLYEHALDQRAAALKGKAVNGTPPSHSYMGLQNTCHPTQVNTPRLNPSQTGRYSIYQPRRDERLSKLVSK